MYGLTIDSGRSGAGRAGPATYLPVIAFSSITSVKNSTAASSQSRAACFAVGARAGDCISWTLLIASLAVRMSHSK